MRRSAYFVVVKVGKLGKTSLAKIELHLDVLDITADDIPIKFYVLF